MIHLHTVKWFQVLLCITSNSIRHQSFANTQLNDKKKFYFWQFNLARVICLHSVKCLTFLFDPLIGSHRVLSLVVWAMTMKEYSTFPKSPGLKSHCQTILCHIQDTRWVAGLTSFQRKGQCVLQYQPTGQGDFWFQKQWNSN